MKKRIFILVILIILSIAGFYIFKNKIFSENKKGKEQTGIIKVKRGDISISVNVTGTIKPLKVVELKSKASGKIIRMPVEKGDYLKEGELVAEIEKTFTQPVVDQSKAELNAAKARLEKIKVEIGVEKESNKRLLKTAENNLEIAKIKLTQLEIGSREEEIKRAEANLEKAKSNLDLYRGQYERIGKLGEKGFVSKDELESLKAKLESAKSDYELASQSLELTKKPVTKEELDMAKLAVRQAELEIQKAGENIKSQEAHEKDIIAAESDVIKQEVSLKLAEDNLKDTIITAPISGTILQKNVEEGQVISSGMSITSIGTTIATMANLAKVYINANVDETDIGKINNGQLVKITVDAFPKKHFEGRVIRIAPEGVVVQNVTTFEVTVEIKNPTTLLKPGMNASLEMLTAEAKDVLFVPNDVIKDRDGKKTVSILSGGKPVEREIKTGINNWEFTEVVSGLNEGEIISRQDTGTKKGNKGTQNVPRPPGLFGR
ncbi:MAG: efflux RND transporter periplasmic adaptor subunit [bacterium]